MQALRQMLRALPKRKVRVVSSDKVVIYRADSFQELDEQFLKDFPHETLYVIKSKQFVPVPRNIFSIIRSSGFTLYTSKYVEQLRKEKMDSIYSDFGGRLRRFY